MISSKHTLKALIVFLLWFPLSTRLKLKFVFIAISSKHTLKAQVCFLLWFPLSARLKLKCVFIVISSKHTFKAQACFPLSTGLKLKCVSYCGVSASVVTGKRLVLTIIFIKGCVRYFWAYQNV